MLAIDASPEALEELSAAARSAGVRERIELLQARFEELGEADLGASSFQRALSCYALYYAREPGRVLGLVQRALQPDGVFFFCGPAARNNDELKRFHYSLRAEDPPAATGAAAFMEEEGQRLARELFAQVTVTTFENPLEFASAEALYDYWSSYNLYDEQLDAEFRAAAADHFRTKRGFRTVKRVVGVRAVK